MNLSDGVKNFVTEFCHFFFPHCRGIFIVMEIIISHLNKMGNNYLHDNENSPI